MVRRMAMSAVLVRTSITRLDTMLKAATSTIMVSTRNITLVCAWMAAKKPIVGLEPVEHPALAADRLGRPARSPATDVPVAQEDLDGRDLVAEIEHALRRRPAAHRRNWSRSRTCRRRRSPPPWPRPSAA